MNYANFVIKYLVYRIMKIYFDLCSLKRPFDDLSITKNAAEAAAIQVILLFSENNLFEIISSDPLLFENSKNSNYFRLAFVSALLGRTKIYIHNSNQIESRAFELQKSGIRLLDSLHIACAEEANADYFCSTDIKLIQKAKNKVLKNLKVINPVELLEVLYNEFNK
ncbi:MAG: hypothetical protein HW421_2624 [Ignavibacteria bacterium]|nr:hypothetical protein [Ignavibacteria bacterium]